MPGTGIHIPTFPNVPTDTITLLSEFIEYSNAGETDLIEELLTELQIQSARLRSMVSDIPRDDVTITTENVEDYLIDTAGLHARASASFNFFRGMSENLPREITGDDVRSALGPLKVYKTSFPDVYSNVDEAAQNSDTPKRWQ